MGLCGIQGARDNAAAWMAARSGKDATTAEDDSKQGVDNALRLAETLLPKCELLQVQPPYPLYDPCRTPVWPM